MGVQHILVVPGRISPAFKPGLGSSIIPADIFHTIAKSGSGGTVIKSIMVHIVEFIWIMSKFKASTRENIEQLIRTPTMRALLSAHQTRVNELVESLPKSQEIEF